MSDLITVMAGQREQRPTGPPFLALKVGVKISVMFLSWTIVLLGDSGCGEMWEKLNITVGRGIQLFSWGTRDDEQPPRVQCRLPSSLPCQ